MDIRKNDLVTDNEPQFETAAESPSSNATTRMNSAALQSSSPEALQAYYQQVAEYYRVYYPDYYAAYYGSVSSGNTSSNPFASIDCTAYSSNTHPFSFPAAPMNAAELPKSSAPLSATGSTNKAMRQMSHYFDYEQFNIKRNQDKVLGKDKPTKFSKKEIETLKERRHDIKKKRLMEWLKKE